MTYAHVRVVSFTRIAAGTAIRHLLRHIFLLNFLLNGKNLFF
jgi:hypothetical protein